jgi:hypothetical protein
MGARAGSAPTRYGISVGALIVLTALVLTFFAWINRAIDDPVVEPRPSVVGEASTAVRPGAVEGERWTMDELLEARAIADAQRRELAGGGP